MKYPFLGCIGMVFQCFVVLLFCSSYTGLFSSRRDRECHAVVVVKLTKLLMTMARGNCPTETLCLGGGGILPAWK